MTGDLGLLLLEAGQLDRDDAEAFRFLGHSTLGVNKEITKDFTGSAELLTAERCLAALGRPARL